MKIDFLRGPAVSISASADDWELYNAETLEREQDRDFVTESLNRGLEEIIARSPTRKEINIRDIDHLLVGYSAWGAADTEGYTMVNQILGKVYGDE